MTHKEALEKVDSINRCRMYVYCPFIRGMCRIDCECYVQATLREDVFMRGRPEQYSDYSTNGGYCSNYALRGD